MCVFRLPRCANTFWQYEQNNAKGGLGAVLEAVLGGPASLSSAGRLISPLSCLSG